MPYGYAGQCYETTADALVAFQKSFPILGDVYWQWHVSSSINASGLITYSAFTKSVTSNGASSVSGTLQLAPCFDVDATPVFDPSAAGAVFAFFFLGVAGTWYLSKNLGLILEAVKRW